MPSMTIKPNLQPNPTSPLNHTVKCHVHLFLNISRNSDSTTSLENVFQCLTNLSVKKLFLISSLNLS